MENWNSWQDEAYEPEGEKYAVNSSQWSRRETPESTTLLREASYLTDKACLQFEQITCDRRDNQALIVVPTHKAARRDRQGQIITVNHSSESTPAPASGGTAEVSGETGPFITFLSARL